MNTPTQRRQILKALRAVASTTRFLIRTWNPHQTGDFSPDGTWDSSAQMATWKLPEHRVDRLRELEEQMAQLAHVANLINQTARDMRRRIEGGHDPESGFLLRCGCPAHILRDSGAHQEGCESPARFAN